VQASKSVCQAIFRGEEIMTDRKKMEFHYGQTFYRFQGEVQCMSSDTGASPIRVEKIIKPGVNKVSIVMRIKKHQEEQLRSFE
jgi:hypothetical protein